MALSKITDYLASTGCTFPQIGLLQPADPFLDSAGEDLRRRIFITQDNNGHTMCLRPEFTIPVCHAHLAAGNGEARYAYAGSVFRQRNKEAAEFTQTGFEHFGNPDRNAADRDCVLTAIQALEAGGLNKLKLVLGDQSVFVALLDAFEIPGAWRKKLVRGFGDRDVLQANLELMTTGSNGLSALPDKLFNAIKGNDRETASKLLAEMMLKDGLPLSGGRTPAAIADRLFEKSELASSGLDPEQRKAIEEFLSIDVELAGASGAIAAFEKKHAITLPGASGKLAGLFEGLSGSVGTQLHYRAGFGRRLDYYTGIVFELYRHGFDKPVAGGGRYDHLMTLLGAKKTVPAVGFSIWVDRIGKGNAV